jgi:lipoprotein-anchoring transpeptidase ErfK/SrfK
MRGWRGHTKHGAVRRRDAARGGRAERRAGARGPVWRTLAPMLAAVLALTACVTVETAPPDAAPPALPAELPEPSAPAPTELGPIDASPLAPATGDEPPAAAIEPDTPDAAAPADDPPSEETVERPVAQIGAFDRVERPVAQSGASQPLDPARRISVPGDPAVAEIQFLLDALGYPAGPIDGVLGARTAQGLCAWRQLEGLEAHRGPIEDDELARLRTTEGLPEAEPGLGVTVDKTCQTVYLRDNGRWEHVLTASTGRGGLPRVGDYRITRRASGWRTSTLYPAPQPNMYNSLFFHGSIAIHGSHVVPPRPASAGCVRVTPAGADLLWARLDIGDAVEVIGGWSR